MWKAVLLTALVCLFSLHYSLGSPTNQNLELMPIDYDINEENPGDNEETPGSGDRCEGMTCVLKGEKGHPGPQGPRGEPGFCDASSCTVVGPVEKGEKGEKGESGKDGEDGKPGETGQPGTAGMKGDPGKDGEPGMKGMTGEMGKMGEKGMEGPPGTPGTPGSTGIPGKQGLPGEPGTPGQTGRKGMPGQKGEKGEPGSTVEIISRTDSEPCNETLQGDIRFDPITKQLYFCNGTYWVCVQTTTCPDPPKEDPTCPSPFGNIPIGDCWYQVFVENVTQATQDAADIVLVIDESGSMITEQEWLLVMVPFLESTLVANGVGDGDVKNRYCVIGFGSFGDLRPGHFRAVDGEPCFTADRFADAQSQLITAGLREDGYEAIKFGLDNIPFRESPFIAKNVILVTDEGRTVIDEGEDITRESIQAELKASDILLNVVVFADYELVNDTNRTVIGVDARGVSLILEPNGGFSETNQSVHITKAEKNTAEDYVDLAVSLGGAAWALRILRESAINLNEDIQASFTSALTQIKLREIRAVIESCRKCVCLPGDSDEEPPRTSCSIANDEQFCRCVVENQGDDSTCESGLPDPTEDDRVEGGLVPTGDSISMVPRSPDFMFLDSEAPNP